MRILHIIASADPSGGGPIEGIVQQCRSLPRDSACEIVSLDPPDAPFLKDIPATVHALGRGRYEDRTRSRLSRFAFSRRLIPWLREHGREYDILIVNGLWNYASVGASLILPRLGVPYVVYVHGMMDPWFRATYPWKHGLKQLFWLLFEGRLMHHARAALFTTEEERDRARGQFFGHRYRERVVAYGIDDVPADAETHTRPFRDIVPGLGDRPYLLFLGRIHPKKGCDLLVEAWAGQAKAYPETDLVIAGPDQTGLVAPLKARADALGIGSRLHWPGTLRGAKKWGALKGADAFILPSHQENFGVAVAEALACGTPVLISDKVNIWRDVRATGAGLVAADDVAGTATLLSTFFALDRHGRARMRAAARQCFLENYDMKAIGGRVLALFEELIGGDGGNLRRSDA
jgi:glycosyltransferase involved in cell wall biosynthesis